MGRSPGREWTLSRVVNGGDPVSSSWLVRKNYRDSQGVPKLGRVIVGREVSK